MIKSIFVGLNLPLENYKKLGEVGANHLIVWVDSVTTQKWSLLRSTGCDSSVSFSAFEKGVCPADSKSWKRLEKNLKKSLRLSPQEIWLDHFRFDGYWESTFAKAPVDKGYLVADTHKPCKWCRGKNRVKMIAHIAKEVKKLVGNRTKVGYFAVPFKKEEVPDLVNSLGQDHEVLGKIFDMASPMLYHRMIGRPVSYISEYMTHISKFSKSTIPIIQIKDMPDDLEDKLSFGEFEKIYEQALKPPSSGVSIFMWEHAVDRDKVSWIKKVFT